MPEAGCHCDAPWWEYDIFQHTVDSSTGWRTPWEWTHGFGLLRKVAGITADLQKKTIESDWGFQCIHHRWHEVRRQFSVLHERYKVGALGWDSRWLHTPNWSTLLRTVVY